MVSIETIMRERDARVNVRNFRYAGFDPASRFSVAWQNPSGTPDQVRGDEDLRGSGLDRLERLHPRRLDTLQLGRELAAALRQVTHRQLGERGLGARGVEHRAADRRNPRRELRRLRFELDRKSTRLNSSH